MYLHILRSYSLRVLFCFVCIVLDNNLFLIITQNLRVAGQERGFL